MPAQYKVIVSSSAGVKQAEFIDFDWLSYSKRLNTPGKLRFRVGANHNALQYMVDKAQVEVYRRNTDPAIALDWYADFTGIIRDDVPEQTEEGRDIVTLDAYGPLHMLEWRIIDWKTGTANRNTFTSAKAETLMKLLVQYNITSSATAANGRNADGTMASPVSISIQTDTAAGNTIGSWNCAYRNLLAELQSIAKVGGGDFDLIKTGAATFEFRWYTGQRGTDRRTGASAIKFDTKLGNMARPKLTRLRSRVRTRAAVAGRGTDSAREYSSRTANGYVVSSNNVEMFVDARNLEIGASLSAEGDAKLAETKLVEDMQFKVVQMPSCYYGKHYLVGGALGDLVKVAYRDYIADHKATGVMVSVDEKGEQIEIESEVYA